MVCTHKCEETKPVLKSGLNAVKKGRYNKVLTRIQEGKNIYNCCGNIIMWNINIIMWKI